MNQISIEMIDIAFVVTIAVLFIVRYIIGCVWSR